MIRFSIVIPVYNVEKHIYSCIESVINQSHPIDEMILVDDGSTDASGQICDKYSEKHTYIKVIHQKNGGLSNARNTGIKEAIGDYILFLDSDDVWDDDAVLSTIAHELYRNPVDVLSFNYYKFTNEHSKKTPYFNIKKQNVGSSLKDMVDNNIWIACAWNKVVKRQVIMNNNLFFKEGVTSEDIDWCARLAVAADSFGYINNTFVGYRQRATSISNNITLPKIENLLNNIKKCVIIARNTSADKRDLLFKYIAYQVATLIFNIALLRSKSERKLYSQKAKKLLPLLKYSNSVKAKGMLVCCKTLGINNTIELIALLK